MGAGFDVVPHLIGGDIVIWAIAKYAKTASTNQYRFYKSADRGATWASQRNWNWSSDAYGAACVNTPYDGNTDGNTVWASLLASAGSHGSRFLKTTNGFTDNALQYTSPAFGGVKVNAGVYIDDSNEDEHGMGAGISWSGSGINVGLQYAANDTNVATIPGVAADGTAMRVHGGFKGKGFSVAASYEVLDNNTADDPTYLYLTGTFNMSDKTRLVGSIGVVGEGAYVKYEMWLRRLESDRAGLVGLSGSFFAARSEVCENWDILVPSDFNTALNSAKHGLVAITCPEVVGVYKDVKDPGLEYRRKMRTVIRGITAIARHPEVLNPFRMRMFAFQVWSHKIMRWGVPWFMAVFLLLTWLLQGQGLIYTLALLAQCAFYGLAIAGWLSVRLRKNTLIKIIFFFVQTNLALAQATVSFLLGKRMTVWTPSKR